MPSSSPSRSLSILTDFSSRHTIGTPLDRMHAIQWCSAFGQLTIFLPHTRSPRSSEHMTGQQIGSKLGRPPGAMIAVFLRLGAIIWPVRTSSKTATIIRRSARAEYTHLTTGLYGCLPSSSSLRQYVSLQNNPSVRIHSTATLFRVTRIPQMACSQSTRCVGYAWELQNKKQVPPWHQLLICIYLHVHVLGCVLLRAQVRAPDYWPRAWWRAMAATCWQRFCCAGPLCSCGLGILARSGGQASTRSR